MSKHIQINNWIFDSNSLWYAVVIVTVSPSLHSLESNFFAFQYSVTGHLNSANAMLPRYALFSAVLFTINGLLIVCRREYFVVTCIILLTVEKRRSWIRGSLHPWPPGVGSPRYPLMHASVTQLQMSCLMTYGGRWWVFWRSSYTSTGRSSSRVCLNYWMSKPVELANSTCLIIWSWVGEEHSFCILKDPISGVFSIFTPVFGNDSNMLICCSRNILYYYTCWKQLSCVIFLWKPWSKWMNALIWPTQTLRSTTISIGNTSAQDNCLCQSMSNVCKLVNNT